MKNKYLVLGLILVFSLMVTNSYSADEWDKTRPISTNQKIDWPDASQANNEALDRVLANYREGVTISYLSTSTVSVSAGEVVCMNAAGSLKKMRQNTSATTVTWADIDTGAEANSTTYTVFAVADADAATFTIKISASSSAPSGATYYKKLGSFYNNSDGNITLIKNDSKRQLGDKSSKTIGTTYQAATDGFVYATVYASVNDTMADVKILSDGSSSPTTVVCFDRTGEGVATDSGTPASCSWAVKAGDYYKSTMTNKSGSSFMYFVSYN